MASGDFLEAEAGDTITMMKNENIDMKDEFDLVSDQVGDICKSGESENLLETKIEDGLARIGRGLSSVEVNPPKRKLEKEEKYGHRRVHADGGVSYKKISSTVIMESIQIGIQKSVSGLARNPERDVLMKDFMTVESTTFTVDNDDSTSRRKVSFLFKTYAPIAFRHFRDLFGIKPDDFVSSFCNRALVELSNPGASGSLFYLTHDDEFIIKTVQHREATFLQKLLPGYYLNLNQNPRTLLPKFFGLYCCKRDSKNVRMVVMNNVLSFRIKLHQRYDLKGSTYNRSASKLELEKDSPTFKDLDFKKHHPEGIFLESEVYIGLMKTLQRDCRVLESFQIMDYSLLVGVHNLDKAKREEQTAADDKESEEKEVEMQSGDGVKNISLEASKTCDSSCKETSTSHEREESQNVQMKPETNFHKSGIPARHANGENLLLFLGIIDILQSYNLPKKLEHVVKSVIHDGDSVSVHNPTFYAQRFHEFIFNKVFKALPASPKSSKRKSQSKLRPGDLKKDE